MSVPTAKPLLSTTEKDRLKNPPIDPNIRKRNNLIVKEKIKRWLNDAKDIYFALDHLRDTKMEGVFPDEDIFALFRATEKLLDRLNFAPVQGEPQHPFIGWLDIVQAKDIRKNEEVTVGEDVSIGSLAQFARRATPSDLERNWQVQDFVRFLNRRYPSDPEKESPAYKKYRRKKEYQAMKEAAAKHGMRIPRMWDGEDMEADE
jgi:hypothetical protein